MRAPLPRPARRWLKARFPGLREGAIEANARLLSAASARAARRMRWTVRGADALGEALADGPVVIALWHEGLLLAPPVLVRLPAPVASVHSPRPIGRVGSAHVARLGLAPIDMRPRQALAGQREALRWMRAGGALAMAADGPSGPARIAKAAVVEMAAAARAPIWLAAFAQRGARRLPGWDGTLWPRRGPALALYAPGPPVPDRRAGPEAARDAAGALTRALEALREEAAADAP
ncbi:hypothetical protein [Hasllibacter halocynthiae]|nr:hypothetical protein [Hasllibacter halocynthiae]